jgi:Putative ABC exporter
MHPALWFLLWLRFYGWLRRLGRNLRTVKGAALAILGILFLVPCLFSWIFSLFVLPAEASPQKLEEIRHFGPLALLGFTVVSLLSSAGERGVVAFTPAEVAFLFTGPFSRRQLLAYKMITALLSSAMIAIFSLFWLASLRLPSAMLGFSYLAVVLALMFVQLVTMAIGFIAGTIGVQAYNRRRKLILVGLAAVALAALLQVGGDLFRLPRGELADRLEQTPLVYVLLEPFRWFVRAFTAERVWPDFARWGGLGLAVDVGLLLGVFALDAQYLESAAAASERIYAQLQRLRTGGAAAVVLSGSGTARSWLPMLPWWGGIGPVAWRQLATVPRSRSTLVILLMLFPLVGLPALSGRQDHTDGHVGLAVALGAQVGMMTLFLTPLIAFDFRGDLDRIDVLKTWPIRPVPLAIGQLLAPVLLICLVQWIALAVIAATLGRSTATEGALGTAALAIPFNFLLIGLDNLLFLLFPSRAMTPTPGDFQVMGRLLLTYVAKLMILGLAVGAAALIAVPAYFLLGRNLPAAVAAAWLVLAAFALGQVPLIVLAFRRFDVARDTPP